MLDKLLELEEIRLIPCDYPNMGRSGRVSFNVVNHEDNSTSLPIFTSPMSSVVGGSNYQAFFGKGIRPILPKSEDINYRLEGCQYIFSAFTLREVTTNFLSGGKRVSDKLFRICIENGNGHDAEILNVASNLRRCYGNQVCIMAGNIGNPKMYIDYCKAGIDYARVGIGSSSQVNNDIYGFHYPMASLLMDIRGVKTTACTGLKHTKIIADGGILSPVEIIKAMAVGADYVMMGKGLARLAEACGPVKSSLKDFDISQGALSSLSKRELIERRVLRLYSAQALYEVGDDPNNVYDQIHNIRLKPEAREEWVSVNTNLQSWLMEAFDIFQNAFVLSRATCWSEYKTNVKFIRAQSY